MKSYLKKLWWKYTLRLTSAFNSPSLLKSRILMLYRKPSGKISLAKFAFALPVLSICLLVSAFAQKNLLPPALLVETQKVANKLAEELQTAFLPTSNEDKTTKDEEKEDKKAEKKEEKSEKKEKSLPTESKETSKELPAIAPVVTIPQVTPENTGKNDDADDISLVPMKVVANDEFAVLKKYTLNPDKKEEIFQAICTEGTYYLFKVVDARTNAPISGTNVNIRVRKNLGGKAKIENEEVTLQKSGDDWFFEADRKGLYTITVENPSQIAYLAVECSFKKKKGVFYENSNNKGIELKLVTSSGKDIELKKKVSIKNGLKLVSTDANKSYDIKQASVYVFRKGKLLTNKVFYSEMLDVADMKIKKGDAIQISILEAWEKKSDGTSAKADIKYKYIAFFAK